MGDFLSYPALQNRNTVSLNAFQTICKLFVKDNFNSKSIDNLYTMKPGERNGFDEEAESVRKALSKMDQGFLHYQIGSVGHIHAKIFLQ